MEIEANEEVPGCSHWRGKNCNLNSDDHNGNKEDKKIEEKDKKKEDVVLPDCKKCSEKVLKDALQCDMCDWWIHVDCEGMKRAAYNFFGRYNYLWFCSDCTDGFKTRKDTTSEINENGSCSVKHCRSENAETIDLTKNYLADCKMELLKELKTIIPRLVKESLPQQEKCVDQRMNEKHSIIFQPKDTNENNFSKKTFSEMLKVGLPDKVKELPIQKTLLTILSKEKV